jgi:adenylylsulfate kinase-like enzyme
MWFYIHAPLEVCLRRDPKGLYDKAKTGTVTNLLNFPFDVPRGDECENFVDTVANDEQRSYDIVLERALEELSVYAI